MFPFSRTLTLSKLLTLPMLPRRPRILLPWWQIEIKCETYCKKIQLLKKNKKKNRIIYKIQRGEMFSDLIGFSVIVQLGVRDNNRWQQRLSECLDPFTEELLCCLPGRYGSIQILWMSTTLKQLQTQRPSWVGEGQKKIHSLGLYSVRWRTNEDKILKQSRKVIR